MTPEEWQRRETARWEGQMARRDMTGHDATVAAFTQEELSLVRSVVYGGHDVDWEKVGPRLLATLDAARANSTDAAIAAVEAVLPEGWELHGIEFWAGEWNAVARVAGPEAGPGAVGEGQTIPAALYALRDALLARPPYCPECGGQGWVAATTADPLPSGEPGEPYQVQRSCPECDGGGQVARQQEDCPNNACTFDPECPHHRQQEEPK